MPIIVYFEDKEEFKMVYAKLTEILEYKNRIILNQNKKNNKDL